MSQPMEKYFEDHIRKQQIAREDWHTTSKAMDTRELESYARTPRRSWNRYLGLQRPERSMWESITD